MPGRIRKSGRRRLAAFGLTLALLVAPLSGGAGTALAQVPQPPPPVLVPGTTFTVNTSNDVDDGACNATHCSFREAINATNARAALPFFHRDGIVFDLPQVARLECTPVLGGQICRTRLVIEPIVTNGLPAITFPVTVNATTQPQFNGTPVVEVRSGTSGQRGLTVARNAPGTSIRGLSITGFGFAGIEARADEVAISGSYIGLEPSGGGRANRNGIFVTGDRVSIGGGGTGDRNVISGNLEAGILICRPLSFNSCAPGGAGSETRVIGNLIGTNAAGTAALANDNGINVLGSFNTQFNTCAAGPDSIQIGQTGTTAARNVISGNRRAGVQLGECVRDVSVSGNYIGTNAAGTAAVANGDVGVRATRAPNTAVVGNVISGNALGGIHIALNSSTAAASVRSNFVGTDAGGTQAIPNGGHGIALTGSPNNDAPNTVGGSSASSGNTIAFNTGAGVQTAPSTSIRFNSIHSNSGLGIDRGALGVTANSAFDSTGRNFPQLSTATSTSTSVTISGVLRSEAGRTFTLDFYASPSCDPSGHGEGKRHLGSSTITLDPDGSGTSEKSFNVTFATVVPVGDVVTATSTNRFGETSEFSACETVASSGATGSFAVSPRRGSSEAGDTVPLEVTWTVPAGRVWRNLATIDLRLREVGGSGQSALVIRWEEPGNTFALSHDGGQRFGSSSLPGDRNVLAASGIQLDMAATRVVGSGPTGPSVTLTLPLRFTSAAAGRTYLVELAARDDLGHDDDFLQTGEWTVTSAH